MSPDKKPSVIGQNIRELTRRFAHDVTTPTDKPLPWFFTRQRTRQEALLDTAAMTAGAVVAAGGIGGLELFLHPELFKKAETRIEFNDVWDELQAFLNPPTDAQLMNMVYNPEGKIKLTLSQMQNLLFVVNGDSMNLAFGVRKNSLGPNQPDSWVSYLVKNLKNAASAFGIKTDVKDANYAQPGAARGLVTYEFPEGNVQLGALTEKDMEADHKGELPPVQVMINHFGEVIGSIGMNGDHEREAADKLLGYIGNDEEFRAFCQSPSEETLTPNVKKALKDVLQTYKKNIQQFAADFQHALSIYEKVNTIRTDKDHSLSPIKIICTLPINYRYAKALPYQPISEDGKRTTGGHILLDDYPNARSAAMRLTSSYYQTINPMLEDFHKRTGIEVHTIPMLDLSRNQSLFAEDGHLTAEGGRTLGNQATMQKYQVVDDNGLLLGNFQANGSFEKIAA